MRVIVRVSNGMFSPEKVKCDVSIDGSPSFELSPDEAAEQLRDAWQRVVVPMQDSLKATLSSEEMQECQGSNQEQ